MRDKDQVARVVREAFATTPYPGDPFLMGSSDGCEPEEEVGPFRGRLDRDAIEPGFLDGHYCALGFFSEGAFRYFLPAYLLADLDGRLLTADPVFHLAWGFTDQSTEIEVDGRRFARQWGGATFVNPRRYGAMTWVDHTRYRLSVFSREEAVAIVAYLEYKREGDDLGLAREAIDRALDRFWRDRAASAPTSADLAAHQAAEEAFGAAVRARRGRS